MDLVERQRGHGVRHPWETARAEAIRKLVARLDLPTPTVLDVGCGDGFLIAQLRAHLELRAAVAQDVHLTPELARELAQPGVEFVRDLDQLRERRFDLVLLLDVLEHVQEPGALLTRLSREHLTPGGRLLITVPAFQALFSEHDRALQHVRRYSRSEIAALVRDTGLAVHAAGYLFSSLLLPRAISTLRERLWPPRPQPVIGVGAWSGPPWLTRSLHQLLCADNRLCLKAQEKGLIVPGLSAWILCSAR
ncbi:MAG TPA: methyltransferase domain-containing protein [Polyangiaceae bacterium]|nr:methyltransferase domain-containing protein [Polyangiaceae bacterium]